jgi:hypothetical protein
VLTPRGRPQTVAVTIVSLCEAADGAMWAGTDGGGITRYDHGA